MQFQFENLGPIENAKLDIADLTVLTGHNNTGKTYLTYALYGFLSRGTQWVRPPKLDLGQLYEAGTQEFDLEPLLAHRQRVIEAAASRYASQLDNVLASDPARFEATAISVGDLPDLNLHEEEYANSFQTVGARDLFDLRKPSGSSILTATLLKRGGARINPVSTERIIGEVITGLLFGSAFPKTFIASTERTGAVMFRAELNLAKNRLIELAQEMKSHQRLSTAELVSRIANSDYPLPVRDNVDFVNRIESIQRQQSVIAREHPHLLGEFADLIGGEYKVDRQGELSFQPARTRGTRLRMGESSSAVRSLLMLRFYLFHEASYGDLLIIDEPELNLHPCNQRKLARLLVSLISIAKMKIFITTHSDYILREINTLIQLNGAGKSATDIRAKYGYYGYEGIAAERVRVYALERSGKGTRSAKGIRITSANIDPVMGIDHTTFDNTIVEMTNIQSELLYLEDAETTEG